jgi:peroxiredoxin Q/BCP
MNSVKAGDRAPDFTTQDDAGGRLSLSDLKGKWVALFFYPKDDTPG